MKNPIDWNLQGDARYAWAHFSEDFKGSMERYLLDGLRPGGFAEAMLAHDLERALFKADTHNRQVFWAIAMWIRDRLPSNCQGSYAAVDAWCEDQDGTRTAFREHCEKAKVWLTLVK